MKTYHYGFRNLLLECFIFKNNYLFKFKFKYKLKSKYSFI